MEPTVVAQDVQTIETVKSKVVTNKTIHQRTANTNATQVIRYDASGKVLSSESDSQSWEDRNTQSYEWANKGPPPEQVQSALDGPPPGADSNDQLDRIFTAPAVEDGSTAAADDPDAMVLTSAERRDVAPVCWTGTAVDLVADEAAGTQQQTTTKMEGSQWSRSGEAVWISSSTPSKKAPDRDGQKAVDSAPTTVANGSVAAVAPPLSVEERRRRRCEEARARKAASVPAAASVAL